MNGNNLMDNLANWWDRLWMDDLDNYFSQAKDATEVGYMMRGWNEYERRGRPPLL